MDKKSLKQSKTRRYRSIEVSSLLSQPRRRPRRRPTRGTAAARRCSARRRSVTRLALGSRRRRGPSCPGSARCTWRARCAGRWARACPALPLLLLLRLLLAGHRWWWEPGRAGRRHLEVRRPATRWWREGEVAWWRRHVWEGGRWREAAGRGSSGRGGWRERWWVGHAAASGGCCCRLDS